MKTKYSIILSVLVITVGLVLSFAFGGKFRHKIAIRDDAPNMEGSESTTAMDNLEAAMEYEFEMTKDPVTGKIPTGIREAELAQARDILIRQGPLRTASSYSYTFQGPNNLGGRTRTVQYDTRFNGSSNQVILAGGVSGGVFKSTNDGATWTRKSPTGDLFSVTGIAQDPRGGSQDTWYYCTGEALGNSASETGASYRGYGVWKSTDNGETWSRLANSNTGVYESFDDRADYCWKIIVNPVNGDIYLGETAGIMRSQDGGSTWSLVLSGTFSSSSQATDIVCTSGGRLYAAFGGTNSSGQDGVWTSTTGDSGSWTRIAGGGTPAGWNANAAYGRVVLALAPSNENILYALYYNNIDNDCTPSRIEAEFFKWDQSGSTWVDRSANLPDESGCLAGNDPFAVQGGYDLVIGVKPNYENAVFIGGTNIYRSTDGFATTGNTTRIGGYASSASYAIYTNSHPDIHGITFKPGDPLTFICTDDGGIQRTTDDLASTVSWSQINTGYRTYQYYYATIDPRNANTKVLGGAQDNGTTRNIGGTGTDFESVWTGDGVSVGLSDLIGGSTYEYVGSQSGSISRRNSLSSPGVGTSIKPSGSGSGLFVTLFKLDNDNTDYLYYASTGSLYRNTSASTATTLNWTTMTGVGTAVGANFIRSLAATRGTYSAGTASLFIGTSNSKLFRLDDPVNVAAGTSPVDISGGSFPAGATVSSIAVNPRNDDTVIITFSNYAVTSVWWTGNANSATPTWLNVEGNLTLPSFRSAVIAINNSGVAEYYVGTSVGLYKATINGASPGTTSWAQEGPTAIGNAVVTSLALRTSDGNLLVGTHGVGMWLADVDIALRVHFVRFSGRVLERQNELSWDVENEAGCFNYELQRKYPDEPDYQMIANLGCSNTGFFASYSFKDSKVDLGRNLAMYRVKQNDRDGRFVYSSVVTLQRPVSAKFIEYVSAGPTELFIRVNGQNEGSLMSLSLFDMQGRKVLNSSIRRVTGSVNISHLPNGIYLVRIVSQDGYKFDQNILKQ